jgi:predicted nucleotidyltransferase
MAPTVNPVEAALYRIQQALDQLGAEFALIGGLAVSTWTNPRTTRDVDLAVASRTDGEVERIIFGLQERGYTLQTLLEHEPSGRIATARLMRATEPGVFVDLLFASAGIEIEIVGEAKVLDIVDGMRLAVAAIPHLIAMKTLARNDRQRPQDWDDLRALTIAAQPSELERARELLRLIEVRGFNRGRDLSTEFARFLDEMPSS